MIKEPTCETLEIPTSFEAALLTFCIQHYLFLHNTLRRTLHSLTDRATKRLKYRHDRGGRERREGTTTTITMKTEREKRNSSKVDERLEVTVGFLCSTLVVLRPMEGQLKVSRRKKRGGEATNLGESLPLVQDYRDALPQLLVGTLSLLRTRMDCAEEEGDDQAGRGKGQSETKKNDGRACLAASKNSFCVGSSSFL